MIGPVGASCAIEAMVASSVLMVVVLLLREPVRRMFGANVAYALWALPVLRLALPPLPLEWTQAAHDVVSQATAVPLPYAAESVGTLLIAPVSQPVATVAYPWIIPIVAALWLVGAGGLFLWHMLSHRRFCKRMLAGVSQQIELDGVQVIESDAATGPLAFGVVRRYVAFPRDFAERYEPEERDLALEHELGHHARGDLIANWIALGVLAIHWFNPIAWRAFRAFRADQEIATDARVLAGLNPMRRHVYACAIVKAAHPALYRSVTATCHLNTIDDLKRRLRMLTTHRPSRSRLVGGGAVIAGLTLGGLGLTASGSAAAEHVRSGLERTTGVNLAALASHQTPPLVSEPPTPPPVASGRGETTVVTLDKDGKRIVLNGRYVKLGTKGHAVLIRDDGSATPVPEAPEVPERPEMPEATEAPEVPEVPDVPDVRSLPCGRPGETRQVIVEDRHDRHRHIILCRDRIAAAARAGAARAAADAHRDAAAAAAHGAQLAMNGERIAQRAYRNALEGVRTARARMLLNRDMTAQARQRALEGMDGAIARLESEQARSR